MAGGSKVLPHIVSQGDQRHIPMIHDPMIHIPMIHDLSGNSTHARMEGNLRVLL